MVEEGEFKKRIKETLFATWVKLSTPDKTLIDTLLPFDKGISKEVLERWINEAKKEFPASSKLLSWWASLSEEDRRHYLAMYEPDDIRSYHKLDWFLKWFGERV